MTINLGMIIGAICAIALVYIIAEALVRGAAALGVPIHPIIPVLKWAVCACFAIIAIAWAFGVEIPFVNISA